MPGIDASSKFKSFILGLSFFILAAQAFHSTFSGFSQCDSNIKLEWSGADATPPFDVAIVPLNSSQPLVLRVPAAVDDVDTWNGTTAIGAYTLPQLPLAAGTQYIVSLDDARGWGMGGVSTVLTVGNSDDVDCLPSTNPVPPHLFKLQGAPPTQCGSLVITWDLSSSVLSDQVYVRGWVPGGLAFSLNPPPHMANNHEWSRVDVPHGTQFALMFSTGGVRGIDRPLETTPLFTVQGNAESSVTCIRVPYSPSSTLRSSPTTMQPSSTSSSQGTPSTAHISPTAVIIGSIAGGLVVVLSICFIFLWLRHQRRWTALQDAQSGIQTALNSLPHPLILPASSELPGSGARQTSESPTGNSTARAMRRSWKEREPHEEQEGRMRIQIENQPTNIPANAPLSGAGARPTPSAPLLSHQSLNAVGSPVQHPSNMSSLSNNPTFSKLEEPMRHRDGGPAPHPSPPSRVVELPPQYEDRSALPDGRN